MNAKDIATKYGVSVEYAADAITDYRFCKSEGLTEDTAEAFLDHSLGKCKHKMETSYGEVSIQCFRDGSDTTKGNGGDNTKCMFCGREVVDTYFSVKRG